MISDSNVIDIEEFFALKWYLCRRCQRKRLCKERGCFLCHSLSLFFSLSLSLSWSHFLLIISFMNLLSCLRMPVDTNTWHTAIGLFWNVFRGSSVFYLTKCLSCILYSFLLLLITLILLFTVHLCNKNLGLMAFLSLRVYSINIKGNFSVNFLRNVVHFLTCVCFF